MAKSLRLKTKAGKLVKYPAKKIKAIVKNAGFTGKLLVITTLRVLNEAKKLAKKGIITTINLEKALVKAVHNTNEIAVNSVQKFTKKVLK